ncbi:MAG TPA: PEP-CTERM sorting domain-containing protein [Acetobacteraceae bacterium]
MSELFTTRIETNAVAFSRWPDEAHTARDILMRKLLYAATALAGLLAAPAFAAPITGEVSINGDDLFTATQITFTNPANLGATSGSFATDFGTVPPVVDNVVTMISTLTASSTGNLFTISGVPGHLGEVGSLAITPPTSFAFTGGALPSLTVSGVGIFSLTGFDNTPGIWTLTTQGPNPPTVTFSATALATPAPEPASLALLGVGLLGLGCVASRKRS